MDRSALACAACAGGRPASWETFAHEADMGVRGYGATMAQAFEQAAVALTSLITEPRLIRATRRIAIACAAPDAELLLVDWLNRLISVMATEGLVFSRFEVEIDRNRLSGAAVGEAIDPSRHQPAVEVKGATYTELHVGRDPDGRWRAQCVVDV